MKRKCPEIRNDLMIVGLRLRTRKERLVRIPRIIKTCWKFSRGCSLLTRVVYTWNVIKIIMK